MPTPAERKALLFLAGVTVLGASVRVVRAARDDGAADASTRQALARQLAAVDSAKGDERASGSRSRNPRRGGRFAKPRASDSSAALKRESAASRAPKRPARDSVPVIVDLDVATAEEIEKLPRIGPVLAQRIVDDRAKNGAFGSLAGFERVRGVGPAMSAALRTQVTFSGTVRQSNALVEQRLRSPPPSTKPPRRTRRQ